MLSALRAASARWSGAGVRALYLFGSVARDQAEDGSDIDLLFEFAAPPTFHGYMDLKFLLEELLGHPVDLVTRGGLRPRAAADVEREAIRVA